MQQSLKLATENAAVIDSDLKFEREFNSELESRANFEQQFSSRAIFNSSCSVDSQCWKGPREFLLGKEGLTLRNGGPMDCVLWGIRLFFCTIVSCHWKEIFMSGLFALLTVVTLSTSPLILNTFIEVAEGRESFKNEGYVLAILLFFSKSIESLAQRQWYFRSRLIGLKVRSLLIVAIYKKQLRLSNASKMMHSAGEIMNYVSTDAYRIGEFLFWFHQTWTMSLQLCLALIILFRAVGLATIASLVVIILTVLCNAPLAKLQHKFQSKLMVAQDDRLKSTSEALVNMKVLKLYAWESHFKNVIENLRKVEYKWLSAVQMHKAYNGFLFWVSPVLVSTTTSGACYFLRVPLHASNVFTFVATLRLVQEPVRCIPDVIGVVIQVKVAFARIVKFLEAPELENTNIRQKRNMGMKSHSIFINSASFLWEESPLKPTLRNINLEVRDGEKVAICGEVGSAKSTLLAAILGEVPNIQGTEYLMSDGEILQAAPYHQLLASSREFQDLVNAHKETGGVKRLEEVSSSQKCETSTKEIRKTHTEEKSEGDQLIKQEEREVGGIGLKPYMQYLNQNKVALGTQSSKSLFSQLLNFLFRVPMSFYDSTPLGRILSWVSADLSIVDPDVPFSFVYSFLSTINTYANLAVLAVVTWQVLFISIPMIYLKYIGIGDTDDVQLFYYFIESERDPVTDPLVLWLTGGPGCSGFSALVYEIGVANIIFIDQPVGTGFSYARTSAGYNTSDKKSVAQVYSFLRKTQWLVYHPQFQTNPLYIGGDTYSGITVPLLVQTILDGLDEGLEPLMGLQGYLLGNPVTDSYIDDNSRIPYVHRVNLISDELYESERSNDMFCDDIFGESPAGVHKTVVLRE
ncbi:unnamed protein product [Camellia sinensis]